MSLGAKEEDEEAKVVIPVVCGPSSAVARLASSLIAWKHTHHTVGEFECGFESGKRMRLYMCLWIILNECSSSYGVHADIVTIPSSFVSEA